MPDRDRLWGVGVRTVVVAFAVVMLQLAAAPSAAAAPAQVKDTGALIVRAVDPDGAVLPGVLVTVEGALGSRTEFTSRNGATRIPGLAPGEYTATLALQGFKTVVHEGLQISVGRNVEIRVTLELSSIEETITITGESPLVDVKSTNVGSVYSNELIDKAPTASGLWAGVLDHIPGVVTDRVDVGGSQSGQQSRFSSRGGGSDQNVYALNGANTTDPAALGASSTYYSIGSFEEVGVSTGAHDVEVQSPGVMLNMVSKTGSNDWHAGVKLFYENEALVARNVTDEQRARGAGGGNPNTSLGDFDLQGGGPIIRDRAWFFIDIWYFQVDRLIVGLPPAELDDTTLTNFTVNGTVQLANNHKATVRYFADSKFRGNRNAGFGVPPESAWIQDSFVSIPQLQYQGVLGPNSFVDVRYSMMNMDFPLQAKDADSPDPHPDFMGDVLPPSIERTTGALLPGSPPTREVRFLRDNAELSGNLSHYLTRGDWTHDIKAGGSFSRTSSFAPDSRGYIWGFQQQFLNGAPSRVRFWNHSGVDVFHTERPDAPWIRGSALGLYAQDTMTISNRTTMNFGVRYDYSASSMPQQCRARSLVAELGVNYQAACFDSIGKATSWSDIVPRLGLIYDVTGDGRTAIKANYSRYSNQQGVRWAGFLNPNGVGNQLYTWDDANADGLFQVGEQDTLLTTFFPGVNTGIDPELRSPMTNEFSVGVEREIAADFMLSATAIYRNDSSFVEDVNVGVPYGPIAEFLGVPDSYAPVTVTDPGPDGIVGTGDDGGPLTIYDQDPSSFGQSVFFLTNPVEAMGFDFLYNEYLGLSLVAHKRWSNNWQVLASWDIGRAEGTFDGGGAGGSGSLLDDPNRDINREGLTAWDRTHLIKVTGSYLFPDPIGVNLGMFLRVQSGEPMVRSAILPAPVGGGGPREVTINQGTENVRVESRGRHRNTNGYDRLDTIALLDLRAEKQFVLGRYGVLRLYADLFNVFNANTETAIETRSSASYGNIFWMAAPRIFRLGFGWEF